jgi:DNA invertase Pin-like site-specific DNA recombinase
MTFAIAYHRVSTDKQGVSGLGLDAQKEAITTFCTANGLTIINSFQDIDSGRIDDRAGLLEAIALSRSSGAIIVVAKLDRLSRDVHFVSGLLKTGVQFCDTETGIQQNPFMTLVRSCFAQEEARLIGLRTKAALAQAKAKGVKLGSSNPTIAAAAKAGRLNKTERTLQRLTPVFMELLEQGFTTGAALALHLNGRGVQSASGRAWTPDTARAMKRRVLAAQS